MGFLPANLQTHPIQLRWVFFRCHFHLCLWCCMHIPGDIFRRFPVRQDSVYAMLFHILKCHQLSCTKYTTYGQPAAYLLTWLLLEERNTAPPPRHSASLTVSWPSSLRHLYIDKTNIGMHSLCPFPEWPVLSFYPRLHHRKHTWPFPDLLPRKNILHLPEIPGMPVLLRNLQDPDMHHFLKFVSPLPSRSFLKYWLCIFPGQLPWSYIFLLSYFTHSV